MPTKPVSTLTKQAMSRGQKLHHPEDFDEAGPNPVRPLEIIRAQFDCFGEDVTQAPTVSSGPFRSIGFDNRQRCQYDLAQLREFLAPHTPIIQVVGDSGTPFDDDKISMAQSVLASYVADGAAIEYGFTASKHDTNWLVNDYQTTHPQVKLIANLVEEVIEAMEAGWEGSLKVSVFVVLFDRLSSTRFGDDVWLSDGIMRRERRDKMLCFEGGPQALYQCCSILLKGIQVVAVTNLRSARFSAARFLAAFKIHPEQAERYLEEMKATPRQANIAWWCLACWGQSGRDIASLIVPVDASEFGEEHVDIKR